MPAARHQVAPVVAAARRAADQARHIRSVTIAGLFAKGCVRATAEAAFRQGLAVEVLQDAACSSDRSRDRA